MVNPTIVNRIFTVLAYIFLAAGILGFGFFFMKFIGDTDIEFYFYLSLMTIVLGFVLFGIYMRVANLSFNRFISQLSNLNEEPTTYIRGNETNEDKDTENSEPKK